MKHLVDNTHEPGLNGVPEHWVVRYYDDEQGLPFPLVKYFTKECQANKFAYNMKQERAA